MYVLVTRGSIECSTVEQHSTQWVRQPTVISTVCIAFKVSQWSFDYQRHCRAVFNKHSPYCLYCGSTQGQTRTHKVCTLVSFITCILLRWFPTTQFVFSSPTSFYWWIYDQNVQIQRAMFYTVQDQSYISLWWNRLDVTRWPLFNCSKKNFLWQLVYFIVFLRSSCVTAVILSYLADFLPC